MRNRALTLCLLPLLAACGGTTITPPPVTTRTAPATAPVNPMSPTVINTVAADYDTAADTFSFTANTVPAAELTEELTYNNGRLRSFFDPAQGGDDGFDEFAYAYQSANSIAAVMATDGNIGEASGTGAYGGITYRRTGAAVVPLTGSAAFAGDYAGYLRNDLSPANDDIRYRINGDVSVTADFDTNIVSGSITNREMRFRTNNAIVATAPSADVMLQNSLLDGNIAFAGNATGGEITAGAWTAASGTYSGVIAGPTGANEAVGGVIINHMDGAVAYTEIGIFAAD